MARAQKHVVENHVPVPGCCCRRRPLSADAGQEWTTEPPRWVLLLLYDARSSHRRTTLLTPLRQIETNQASEVGHVSAGGSNRGRDRDRGRRGVGEQGVGWAALPPDRAARGMNVRVFGCWHLLLLVLLQWLMRRQGASPLSVFCCRSDSSTLTRTISPFLPAKAARSA